jgi:7-cyano-7-deazaguanine synthase
LDSTVLLNRFKDDIKLAVFFDYGSKHNAMEMIYAFRNVRQLGIPIIRIPLYFINEHFESSLLDNGTPLPVGHYTDKAMESTIVPFRNGIMLSICVGIAQSGGLSKILIGAHRGDSTIYPDCRETFIRTFEYCARSGTGKDIQILAPFLDYDKVDIVRLGQELGVDFEQTYTCYSGKQTPCGICGSCIERQEAFDIIKKESGTT